MSNQLLIYKEARPISTDRHRNWSVKAGQSFDFAKTVNSVPLTAVEFIPASADFPIVFAGSDDQLVPIAVMGLRQSQNLFVVEDGTLSSSYTPAFLRRYPFVFSTSDEGKTFTLCIDEKFDGCNEENRGERLFDVDGERTQYLTTVLDFLKEYQTQFTRTQALCKALAELELLEPMNAQITPVDGERITLTGFQAVNRQKLKTLSGENLEKLARTDALELIYVHIHSLQNFNRLLSPLKSKEIAPAKTRRKKAEANDKLN